jgi:glycosyltransferase involved in cell wall biosynthesis
MFLRTLTSARSGTLVYVNTMLPFGAMLGAYLKGAKVLVHVRETNIRPKLLKRLVRATVGWTASQIVYVSNSVMELEAFPGKRADVVYNSISVAAEERARRNQPVWKRNGRFTCLMLCSLKEYKGIWEYIALAKRFSSEPEFRFQLVLSVKQSEVDAFKRQNDPLPANLEIHPVVSDPFSFYADANLLLNLSRVDQWVESFGRTILEAMFCGVPVVVPPVGGPAEMVRDGVEGYLVSAYDQDALEQVLRKVAADEVLWSHHSAACRRRAERYTHETFAAGIHQIVSRYAGRKKALLVHLLNDHSGSPGILCNTAKALSKAGVNCVLLTNAKGGKLDELGIPTIYAPYRYFDHKAMRLAAFFSSQVVTCVKVLQHASRGQFVYVNTMLPFGAMIGGLIKGARVVVHIHENNVRPKLLDKFLRAVIGFTAERILFVSESASLASFPGKQQSVVWNSLEAGFEERARAVQPEWRKDGVFEVLMVCSLKAYKGTNEFVELARGFKSDDSVRFKLVLNAQPEAVDEFRERGNLPGNLECFPTASDVLPYYGRASLVMNLSRPDQWVETFGLTILEAMSCGVPVVAPPVGGPAELVRSGVEGFLCDPRDGAELQRVVREVCSDQELWLRLSAACRKRAAEFSSDSFERSLLKSLGLLSEEQRGVANR